MNPLRLIVILLLTVHYLPLHAQELKPAELVAMKKYKTAKIDSIMTAKGFEKKPFERNADFSITVYIYTYVDGNSTIQRSLQVGVIPGTHALSLEYGVWQKTDAAAFITQLLQDGFKKKVTSMPVIGSTERFQTVSYKKAPDEFSYKEVKQNSGMLYIFSIENENYKL